MARDVWSRLPAGCSQAAVLPGGPALIRNYDWDYRLFDGVVAKTAYTGRRVPGVERQERLEELLAASTDVSGVIAACLRPPLYATRFHEGFGTLDTAEYQPAGGGVNYHWPGQSWPQSLDRFQGGSLQIQLRPPA